MLLHRHHFCRQFPWQFRATPCVHHVPYSWHHHRRKNDRFGQKGTARSSPCAPSFCAEHRLFPFVPERTQLRAQDLRSFQIPATHHRTKNPRHSSDNQRTISLDRPLSHLSSWQLVLG
eukprot:Lithocolla_globosa_v1_NODE_344_length_4393_cov_24.392577.p4 type:complete len:118 gc:universal NODE_344_length_4393_cov_24.392577:4323-3970(-)